jgi:hypothetical protein
MKKQAGWNPVKGVGQVVDGIVEPSPRRKPKAKKAEEKTDHERVVFYLTSQQAYNIRKAALDARKDASALAREIFTKAGL